MADVIVELVDQQVSQGQAIENVFHYVDTSGAASVLDLLGNYVNDVIPAMKAFQAASLSHVNLRYRQVYPVDLLAQDWSVGLPLVGEDASMPAPTYEAMSIKWLLGNPTVHLSGGFTGHIKRGGCRIGGLPLSDFAGNQIGAPHVAQARAMCAQLLHPAAGGWQLAVCSFLIGNPVAPIPPSRHAVPRLRSHTVTSYAIVSGFTDAAPSTQNTRKFLRGIAS